ncbi:tyrosine-type recombinase/integrase [Bacillus badius]|uniref:Phage integrase n=1 Tax=Bacillus badius TaxID=1455 RepID=A0ABR5AZP2_BACBA|nr:site-specific integrase [Bacillus badius]KIL80154.1 Phage integrase [Bacillus badius]MED4718404.1 site-specific integrase [Bacillus badius]
MGYVKKDGSSWYYATELGTDPVTGTRKRKKKRGFKTKKEAEKALALVEAEVLKGTYFEQSNILFKDHLTDWFKTKKNSINIQTAQTYQSYLKNRVIPQLGCIKLAHLTPKLLQDYVNNLIEEGLSSSTIKKAYNVIKASLDFAVDMELLSSNPAKKIQLPKERKAKITVWELNDVRTFLEVAAHHRWYIAFHLAITTGMRRGEILGLRWKDIDLEKGVLYVRQTLSKDEKQFLTGAKTISGVRSIKLSKETVVILKKHKATISKAKLKCGPAYEDYDLVICTAGGTPVNPENLKRSYMQLIQQAGVPKIRFHDLRHTHATMLLSQGVHAKVISERLGHSNIKTTLDIYSHVLPNMQQEAANQIDELLSKANS